LPQELLAKALIFPEEEPVVTMMEVVFCPEFMLQEAGTVQKYPVALLEVLME
jgi:hypothetical protein